MSSWRELALVGCALLLPIPLLAVGGGMAPLLPSVVERSIASLLPGATGTSEGAAASGRASVHVPGAGVRDLSGRVRLAPRNLGTSIARDTNEAESTPGVGGAGDASGGAAPSGSGSTPTDGDEPPGSEETPASTSSEPEAPAPGTSRSSDTAAGVQVTLSARGASGAISAAADDVTLSTQASGESDDLGGSLGVTSAAADATVEVAAPDLPAPALPVP